MSDRHPDGRIPRVQSAVPIQRRFRTAGEDYFLWLQIAHSGTPAVFSTQPNVRIGEGVNIYASVEWGTNAALRQAFYNQLYVHELARRFPLAATHKASCRRLTLSNRQKLAENFCSLVSRRSRIDFTTVLRYVVMDPPVLLRIARHAASRIWHTLRENRSGRRSVSK
jgi:hypothetical protein